LKGLTDAEQFKRLCELNVIEQVVNVCETTIVHDAWGRGQNLTVHGLIYALDDGKLKDLKMSASSLEELQKKFEAAVAGT
jgi:carbonic anhydrase